MNQDLCRIASRLSSLTANSGQESTPLNFAVGAVFALLKAETLVYDSQTEPGRGLHVWEEAKRLCQQIAEGVELPPEGEWWAGYFFNDGIIRIAVAFEHLVRQETKLYGHKRFEQMKENAIAEGFSKELLDSWWSIYDERGGSACLDSFCRFISSAWWFEPTQRWAVQAGSPSTRDRACVRQARDAA